MFMRSLSLLFILISLTSCSRFHHTALPSQTTAFIAPTSTAAAFTRVQVNGDIDVALHTGNLHPHVIIQGTPEDKARIKVVIKNGILHISESEKHSKKNIHEGRALAEIHAHYLSSFAYKGTGTVTGNNIQSRGLELLINNNGQTILNGNMILRNLTIKGSGRTQLKGIHGHIMQMKISGSAHVQLAGDIDLAALNLRDDAWVSMYWVKTKALRIRERDRAFVQMAGRVQVLDVELWCDSKFNGRYLRGDRVFAKTHDKAIADISVLRSQHTLASDSSNIYFYNLPDMKADFMAYDGAVLDMREWYSSHMEEYTRYNR